MDPVLSPPAVAELSLVPATTTHDHATCSYVVIGSLSILIWDILCHLRDDYYIFAKHRISFPTIVYFLSRLSALLYLIGYTIIQTTPLRHCNLAIRLATSPLVIALPTSQLLLFLHVRAIYSTERVIIWFFTLLWFSTLASAAIAVISISGIDIGTTGYCTPTKLPRVDSYIGTIAAPLINDTLLFVALVVRIMGTSTQNASTCQLKDKLNTVLFGASIPRLAWMLLQNGQQYFLATVVINLVSLILYASGRNLSLGFLSVTLMNLMVSRLYRKTKLPKHYELDESFQQTHGLPPILFAQSSGTEEVDGLESISNSTIGAPSQVEGICGSEPSEKSKTHSSSRL